ANKPSLEVARRAEDLLQKLEGPVRAPETLRNLRAVEVLEHIGTAQAEEILKSLARGHPDARLTQEAKASLDRLGKRPATTRCPIAAGRHSRLGRSPEAAVPPTPGAVTHVSRKISRRPTTPLDYMLAASASVWEDGAMATSTANLLIQHIRKLVEPGTEKFSDGALLARFVAKRDEAAFTALVQRHGPMVWRVCRRVLPDASDAEDAFQATFLVLCRKAGSVRRQASVGSWLYGVAYRVALQARAAA